VSFPRYPEYKDSGVEWLGEVPVHWEVKRLNHYFKERREKASDKEFIPLSVTMGGIVPRLETAAKTQDGDNRKKVVAGDFVINSRSDRKGSSGISPTDGTVSLICIVLEPQGTDRRFVHHLLRSVAFQEEFYRYGKGIVADLWSTGVADMKNIVLAMPPSKEQRAIAAFLNHETGKIDALIEEQRRLIELLKEKRQAVISHAVTKGLDPNVPMKDSGVEWLGEVPAHWTVAALRWYATIQGGLAKGKKYGLDEPVVSRPYLRVANVQDGHFNLSAVHDVAVGLSEVSRYELREGDVLMNEGGIATSWAVARFGMGQLKAACTRTTFSQYDQTDTYLRRGSRCSRGVTLLGHTFTFTRSKARTSHPFRRAMSWHVQFRFPRSKSRGKFLVGYPALWSRLIG